MEDAMPVRRRQDLLLRALLDVFWSVVLAGVYFGVARISLVAATEHRVVSSIWPPAGIAVFALLRYGRRYWPGIALGAFLLNVMSDIPTAASLAIALGDTLEAVVGAYLVARVMGHRRSLSHVRDVLALTLLGGGVGTMIAATIGVTALVTSGSTSMASAVSLWLVWWTGDAVGVLMVAPFLLVWTAPEQPAPAVAVRPVEAGLLFLALALVTDYVFGTATMLVFAVYPLNLIIAWRHGPRGAATAAAVVTIIASWRTLSGYGPFTTLTPTQNLFALQFFLALLAIKGLVFAAARAEAVFGERRIRASETRYRMLAHNLPEGCVVLYDRHMRLLLVEGPALAGAGFTKEAVEGKRLTDVFDAEHSTALVAPFLAAIDGAEIEFEFGYLERLYLVRVLPVADEEAGEGIGMALALDVTERDRAQREVAESRLQLEQLSRLLLTAQEDERRRVAREVHDELGQALTAVKIGLSQTLARAHRRSSLESERRVSHAADLLDQAIESVQRIVLRLRPGVLDNLGPLAALEYEVQQFRERTEIPVALALPPDPLAIDAEQSTALYRTVQEALTNVIRHAKARRVAVSLLALERDFLLQVADDGVGIAEDQLVKPRSMGILGMRERAAACGGRLDIVRVDSGGTCVMLRIPRLKTGSALT